MLNRTVMAWALLVAPVIGVALPVHAQTDGAAKADPRVAKALKEVGFKYKVTPLGNYRLSFKLDDGRGHWVFVSSSTEAFDRLETRRVWATVSLSKKELSKDVATKLLMDNLKQKLGAFELAKTDSGEYKVTYSARVEADCAPSSLRAAVRLVLHNADDKEKALTGKDDF